MAAAFYNPFKAGLLVADFDLSAVTVRAVLLDTGTYTFSAAHEFRDDLSGVVGGASTAIANKTFVNGVFDGDNVVVSSVTGDTVEAVALYVDTGAAATDNLIAYLDGLTLTPNGNNVNINWNASGIFAL